MIQPAITCHRYQLFMCPCDPKPKKPNCSQMHIARQTHALTKSVTSVLKHRSLYRSVSEQARHTPQRINGRNIRKSFPATCPYQIPSNGKKHQDNKPDRSRNLPQKIQNFPFAFQILNSPLNPTAPSNSSVNC